MDEPVTDTLRVLFYATLVLMMQPGYLKSAKCDEFQACMFYLPLPADEAFRVIGGEGEPEGVA